MKRLLLVILAAVLGWSAIWGWQAMQLRADVANWFEDRRADGWQATYDALQVRGFPNRLDLTLTAPRLEDPQTGTAWQAPFFQVLQLSYRPGHLILIWPDRQTLSLPGGGYEISGNGLRASLIHDAEGVILRSNLEAETLNLAGPDRALALAGLRVGVQRLAEERPDYRLGVHADALARPQTLLGDGRAEGLDLQAEVRFDTVWRLSSLNGPRPQPRNIDLRQAAYRNDGLELDMAGRLDIDAGGVPSGELTLRAENWQQILEAAEQSGDWPEGLVRTLAQGLSLVAGTRGRPDTLDIPLRFSRGEVAIGLIPLGRAPRVWLP